MRLPTPRIASRPSHPSLRAWLMVVLLACSLAVPVSACVHSDACSSTSSGVDMWIGINGQDVMFKFQGLNAVDVQNFGCACGMKLVNSLSSIGDRVQVMIAGTNTPVNAFQFYKNYSITVVLNSSGAGGGWIGFATPNSVPVHPPSVNVDLVLTGRLNPGQTFNDLKTELIAAGSVLSFGAIPKSGPGDLKATFCDAGRVDPLPAAQAAPVIKIGKIGMDHPRTIEISVRDPEEGLATLRTLDATHATETTSSFARGTTAPVMVSFTMAEGQSDGSIGLEACNVRGDCATLRADIVTLQVGLGGLVSRDFSGVPRTKNLIKVQNGDPGATMFILTANDQHFSVRPLDSGQGIDLKVPLALTETENAVTLALRGRAGGEAMVMMVESQP